MAEDELLRAGLAAAKAGDKATAATIFARLVKENPKSEQGWLGLGFCCNDPKQKEFCFQRVLALNPGNALARKQLNLMHKPAPPPEDNLPAWATGGTLQKTAEPVQPPVFHSPTFLPEKEEPGTAQFVEEKPPLPLPPSTKSPSTEKATLEEQKTPKRKKNKLLAGLAWTALFLVLCCGATVVLYQTGMLATWVPSVETLLQTINPTQVAGSIPVPTSGQTPTQTRTPNAQPTQGMALTPEPSSMPTMRPTLAYEPKFEVSQCKFDSPDGVVVRCGYLVVPEDRSDPESANIRLAVAIYESPNENKSPDPVIFLQGGPGGEAVMLSSNAYTVLVEPFLAERDFITFDQRGTGLSDPALECDELTTTYLHDIRGRIASSSRNMVYSNAIRSCHGLMSVEGINLDAYTTAASAADLNDLVKVLGYDQVNLYGASYGTRLAEVTMRDYPEIVRSAILDSVVPIETRIYDTIPLAYESSLNALFDGCASDPKCKTAYPDLETVFWQLVNDLNENPFEVTAPDLYGGELTETVDGSTLVGVTLALLKQSYYIPMAAQSVYRIKAGDYSTFIAAQTSMPFAFEDISIGLYISMMCHEHVMATTLNDLSESISSGLDISLYARLPFVGGAEEMFETCDLWGSTSPALGENEPLVSDIPSLVIEGTYDPATPPFYGKQVAENLSNSYYVEFPNQGHVPTASDESGCAMQMAVDFLDDPNQSPDQTCLKKIKGVEYIVPYTGNPALELETITGYDFTAKMPTDWYASYPGIYLRANSPLDITQIAVLSTYYNSTELLQSLSSKLYGYGNFDGPPIQTGTRQANGLEWDLYQTTSYGRPVELAMADDRGGALVVLLFCHKDEYDALYETVYLPIIDSVKPSP